MTLLNITHYLTVTPRRVVDEANNVRTPIKPIDCVPILEAPQVIVDAHGKRFAQSGQLFVRRGSDLGDGDEITLPQGVFGVVGGALWDMDHPMGGADFGWVEYSIRRGG